MTVSLRPVFSSHIDAIGYDPETKELHVRYKGGKVAIHEEVPASVADKVTGAASIGTALNAHIKGVFPHRYAP